MSDDNSEENQSEKFEETFVTRNEELFEIILSDDGKLAHLWCKTYVITTRRTYKKIIDYKGDWVNDPYFNYHKLDEDVCQSHNEKLDTLIYSGTLSDVYAFVKLKGINKVKLYYKEN